MYIRECVSVFRLFSLFLQSRKPYKELCHITEGGKEKGRERKGDNGRETEKGESLCEREGKTT